MSEILVKTNIMAQCVSSEQAMLKKLNSLAGEIESVQRSLSFNVKSRARINSQLASLAKVTQRNAEHMSSLASTLSNAASTYSSTEKRISGNVNSVSSNTGDRNINNSIIGLNGTVILDRIINWIREYIDRILIKLGKVTCAGKNGLTAAWNKLINGEDIALLSRATSVSGSVLGFGWAASLSGDFLGASLDTTKKAAWNLEDGDVSAEYSVSGEAHIAQGKASGNIGLLGGDIGGKVGKIGATGKVEATLFDDGEFRPSIGGNAKVEAKALEGEANLKFGTEENNAHAKAEGSLFGAEAKASAGIGKVTYEDASGNTKSGYGVTAKVGAEAYVAEGSLSSGFNLFGIKIDASVSGKAGGVGVSAGGSVTTNGVSGKIGAGLGVGGGVEISIDWSNFSLKGLEKFSLKNLFK